MAVAVPSTFLVDTELWVQGSGTAAPLSDPKAGLACAESRVYGVPQLLALRPRRAGVPLLQLEHYPVEELERSLLQEVAAGKLPPAAWSKCREPARREALWIALHHGFMHAVYAMQPESSVFQEQVRPLRLSRGECDNLLQQLTKRAAPEGESVLWLLDRGGRLSVLDDEACARAAEALGRAGAGAERHAGFFLARLESKDSHLRRAAVEMIGKAVPHMLGSLDHQVDLFAAAVTGRLRDLDAGVRQAAVEALGFFSEAIVPHLAVLLDDPDLDVRGAAAFGLARVDGAAAPHVATIASWLADSNPMLRRVAAEALGRFRGRAAAHADALAERLQDEDADVREASAVALGAIGAIQWCDLLADSLAEDADANVREAAARAFQQLVGMVGQE